MPLRCCRRCGRAAVRWVAHRIDVPVQRRARLCGRCYRERWTRRPSGWGFAEQGAEHLSDGFFGAIAPVEVSGAWALVPLFSEFRLSAFLHVEEVFEFAAEFDQGQVEFVPEGALATAGRNTEVEANLGDRAADGTAPDLGFQFLQGRHGEVQGIVGVGFFRFGTFRFGARCGGRAEFHLQRLDIRLLGGRGALGRLDIASLRGAGEQIFLQHHGAQDAALHMREDATHIVRAESDRDCRESGMVGSLGERRVEVLAVAEEDPDHAQNRGDAGGHRGAGPALLGGGWWFGACGMRRRWVHDR